MYMKKNYFVFLMIAVMASFSSCEEDNNPITPGGNGNNGNDNYSLSVQGEVKPITIQSGGSWYAETDDKWLQLSYMGGTGGETVDIIAAYNASPEPRTGEIRIYTDISSKAFKSDTSSIEPSQTIKIEQPGNDSTEKPACFTEFYFENGKIHCTLFGGNNGGTIDSPSESDFLHYQPTGGTVLATSVGANDYKDIIPYINVEGKEELRGFFTVDGIRTSNTLVIRQGDTFRLYNDLKNEGSADMHFVVGNKIYYGGGLVYSNPWGGTGGHSESTKDFKCYDTETGEETDLPDLPAVGVGFGWNGKIFSFANRSLSVLNGNEWTYVGNIDRYAIGVQVKGNDLYVLSDEYVDVYSLSEEGDYVNIEHQKSMPTDISRYSDYTTDENGNLWIFDSDNRKIGWIEKSGLQTVSIPSEISDVYFAGADNGYAYIVSDKAMYKVSKDGTSEMLKLIVTKDFEGERENINGTIYCFGGVKRNSYTQNDYASKEFKSFTPSMYVPVSLSIVPEE